MTTVDTASPRGTLVALAEIFRRLGPVWVPMAGTSLLCSVIATGVVMPVISLMLRWLIARSGAPAVADADIASFFLLSWPGFAALVLGSALLIAAAALEQTCLLAIALAWERGSVLRVGEAMGFGARRAFVILRLTTVLVVRLLVLVLVYLLTVRLVRSARRRRLHEAARQKGGQANRELGPRGESGGT